MINPRSLVRAVVNYVAVAPKLLGTAYRDVEAARRAQERRVAALAHRPTRRDKLAAHLCDYALSLASPAIRVPAKDALRMVIFKVVRGEPIAAATLFKPDDTT